MSSNRTALIILWVLVALAVLPSVIVGILYVAYKVVLALSLLMLSVTIFKVAR